MSAAMLTAILSQLTPPILLFLIGFSVLWKGGKSLEMTWLLVLIAGFAAFVWWSRKTGSGGLSGRQQAVWWLLLAFFLWSVGSFLLSSTQNYGLDELLRDGACTLLFFAAQRGQLEQPFLRRCCSVLAIAGLIACGVGLAVYIFQPVDRFVGTFFDHRFHTDYWPNAWAEFLLLAWPAGLLALSNRQKGLKTDLLRAGALGILIACLLLSYSRGALIAFAGQLGLLMVLSIPSWRRFSGEAVSLARTIGIGAIIAIALFFGTNQLRSNFYPVQSVADKVTFTAAEGTSSIDERSQFWDQSWQLAQEKPWFGWGPYSFRFVQPRLQRHVLATSDHPHNVFLKLAMERGIPAAALFTLFLLLILVPALWQRSKLLPLIAVAGVLAHNLIDFNLQFVGIALPFWLFLGFLASDAPIPTSRDLPVRRILEILLAAVLLIVAILEGRYLVLSSFGRHAEAAGQLEEAQEWYEPSKGQIFSRDLHLSRANLGQSFAIEDYLRVNKEDARAWAIDAEVARAAGNPQRQLESAQKAFESGAYNYVSVVLGMINALQAADADLSAWQSRLDALFDSYASALMANIHFIDLSQNADDFGIWAERMETLYPERTQHYRSTAEKVEAHVAEERSRFAARPPGRLW